MNRNLLVRIAVPSIARLWSGSGPLFLPADAVETTANAMYLGGGELLDGLTDVEQLINGKAERLDLNVSGVTLAAVKLAKEEFVSGSIVDVGHVEFDAFWQISGVFWEAQYRADKLSTAGQRESRTITLSMGSSDTGRSMSPQAYWTPADQNRRSPGDRCFDRVPGYNGGTSRPFGPNG